MSDRLVSNVIGIIVLVLSGCCFGAGYDRLQLHFTIGSKGILEILVLAIMFYAVGICCLFDYRAKGAKI